MKSLIPINAMKRMSEKSIRTICSNAISKVIFKIEKITERRLLKEKKQVENELRKLQKKREKQRECEERSMMFTFDKVSNDEKKRKKCEHPCSELICALILSKNNINIDNIECIKYIQYEEVDTKIKVSKEDYELYIEDFKERLENKEMQQLINFITIFKQQHVLFQEKYGLIKDIYLTGKTNTFSEINILNENVVDKKDAKGDLYICFETNEWIGLSIKAGENATKSNYSIIKYFDNDIVKECQTTKSEYLNNNGFPIFKKEERDQVNALFYEDNPVFTKFREETSKVNIGRQLVDSLYGVNLPYNLYEFNGSELSLLTNRNIDYNNVSFEEWLPYYFKNNGEKRKAAKMFFKLQYNDIVYRVELRWKGVIHTAWPQFQIHSI